jgi:hypothetical protein
MTDTPTSSGHTGDVYGPPPTARSTPMSQVKEVARERVRRDAAAGKAPSTYRADDLVWAFGDSPEARAELEALEATAERVRDEKAERGRRNRAGIRVRSLAESIIKQQDKEAADARMEAAIAEARRRLGLDPQPAPKSAKTTKEA